MIQHNLDRQGRRMLQPLMARPPGELVDWKYLLSETQRGYLDVLQDPPLFNRGSLG